MKKLLATSAIAIVALSGAASAQSVLERVLGQIDNATNLASVNGTFANIAENIGGGQTVSIYEDANGNQITGAEYDALLAQVDQTDYTGIATGSYVNPTTGEVITAAEYSNLSATAQGAFAAATGSEGGSNYYLDANGNVITSAAYNALPATAPEAAYSYQGDVIVEGLAGIDGSINNTIDGLTSVTQEAVASGTVSATEWNMPTLNFGDMATTALGAVNTGDITLGVNSAVDEASTSTTQAVSSVMNQIGGSADTGAIVLNVASNMTGVNGSINNVMEEVNGSIGNLSTTALGAVNTGTITSGVNAAVQGIVGTSGQ